MSDGVKKRLAFLALVSGAHLLTFAVFVSWAVVQVGLPDELRVSFTLGTGFGYVLGLLVMSSKP